MTVAAKSLPRYTVDDYARWEGNWELWQGHPISISPSPFGHHQAIVMKLARKIGDSIDSQNCQSTVLADIDWIVSEDTVVSPDLVVLCGGVPEKHVESPPALIIEVTSPSMRLNEVGFKRTLYQTHRVKHYIIVDQQRSAIEVMQCKEDGKYTERPATDMLQITLCNHCNINP